MHCPLVLNIREHDVFIYQQDRIVDKSLAATLSGRY